MKNGLIKKLVLGAAVAAMAIGLVGCGTSSSGDKEKDALEVIKEKGKVVVGLSPDYAPYEFIVMENGEEKVVGFDVEIAKEVAKDLGVELEIKQMDFEALITALPAEKIDLVISGMNPTEERKKAVDFSEIYYNSQHGILVRAEDVDKYKSFEDLAGKKVGAQLGSTQAEMAEELIDGADLQLLANVNNLILELKAGKIDAIVMEVPVAEMAVKSNPELAVGQAKYEDQSGGNAVAVNKNNPELLAEINKTINRLNTDGSMTKFISDANDLAAKQAEQ